MQAKALTDHLVPESEEIDVYEASAGPAVDLITGLPLTKNQRQRQAAGPFQLIPALPSFLCQVGRLALIIRSS